MAIFSCAYRYDPLDRLINSCADNEPLVKRFYQNKRLVTEVQGTASISLFQYDDLLLAQRDQTSTLLLITDAQRSVINNRQCYSPYGYRSNSRGLSSLLGFNGERPETLTGHYVLGNGYRAYNPVLMRFNSPDSLSPFGAGGVNAYAYCLGDPMNWQDPMGHFRLPIKRLSLIGIGAGAGSQSAQSPSLLTQTVDLVAHSLIPKKPHSEVVVPGRIILDEGLKGISSHQSFTRLLGDTNRNLMSHADPHLSAPHAEFYLNLARKVESGELSNTSAHLSASAHWALKKTGIPRVVGTTFNAAAAFIAAGSEHRWRQTGRGLQQISHAIRE